MDILDALQVIRDDGLSNDTFNTVLDDLINTSHFADFEDSEQRRLIALRFFRDQGDDVNPDCTSIDRYNSHVVHVAGEDYLIVTDDEADEACKENIEECLWAFNANFLEGETGIDAKVFEALQPQCESANDAIRSIIDGSCGIDEFVESAVSADGRGHFLNSYDGEERELGTENGYYFIYQQG